MEAIIFAVYGLWFWLTRGYRAAHYSDAASTLSSARSYLWRDFSNRASTRDRGTLLPHQVEALDILERHSTLACRTSRRFESLGDCCRFISEELTRPQEGLPERRRPTYGRVPSVSFFTPSASGVTTGVTAPTTSTRLQPS
jgi:hypothetical protein